MPYKDKQNHVIAVRTRRRRNRLRAIEVLGGKCVGCGETDPARLEFSHELGEKRIPAKWLWIRRWEVILGEIKKCRLRCGKCHSDIDPSRGVPSWVTEDE